MERLKLITQDCFGALLQLRQAEASSLPPPDQVHRRLRTFIDEMLRRASELGFSQQDTQDIGYAIVAFADELVLASSETMREYWLGNLLQFHYYRENRAGEGFFTRLQALRGEGQRREVLQAYYLCLLFGFQGRYRVRGGELELMQLTEALHVSSARPSTTTRRRSRHVASGPRTVWCVPAAACPWWRWPRRPWCSRCSSMAGCGWD
jgi:type VI secretion system protein ImpK